MTEQSPLQSGPAGEKRTSKALRQVPTVVVTSALAAIAYWGHRTGWTMPRFADLAAGQGTVQKEDWCIEHNVPDSVCIACHPELVGASAKDWCKEHGVAESRCTVCHPEILLKGVAADWCKEHGVPESTCTICHAEIAVFGLSTSLDSSKPTTGITRAPTTQKALPGPDLSYALLVPTVEGKDPKTCQTHARKVQFASVESIKKAGVRLALASEGPMIQTLGANAEIGYDRNRIAQVASRASGTAWRITKDLGQSVKKGELLMLVESGDVGKAKADLLEAAAAVEARGRTLKRLEASTDAGFRGTAELQEAQAALKEAQIRSYNARQSLISLGLLISKQDSETPTEQGLQFAGLPEEIVRELNRETTTGNLLPVYAPQDGIITARNVVAGEAVESSKPLFTITDTSGMWMTLDLPADQGARVKQGNVVSFRSDTGIGRQVEGQVNWISTAIDDQTRTLKVRAAVDNSDGILRANTFGHADMTLRQIDRTVVVPNEAVQWEGCCYVVFVRLSDTIFQTRKVRIGAKANGMTEIMVGVLPGEVVASTGSHVLTAEILKSSLGAGCTD